MISSLLELPVTGAYLRRIGAEPVHFHLAHIKVMENGYPKVIGRIKFSEEGHTLSKRKEDRPTEAEAEGIQAEFADAEFPKIISLAAIAEAPPKCNLSDPNVFVCHDFNDQIIMVHQRYETEDGHKGFLPWTRWSDGQWRVMEPDIMPFYGLPGAKDHSTLFLHEGSKAARNVREMLSGERPAGRFPWLEEMRWGAHIGWIGGVHALDRSDWAKLAALGWKRVVIIADNDPGGRAVVPEIATHFRCPTFVLDFTDSWPESFDLGDNWPDPLFGEEGQYVGPAFSQCLQPATWSTDEFEIPPETENGKPKKFWEIRPEFALQWSWVAQQDLMVHLEMPEYRMVSGKFNNFIRPFSHVKDTLGLFLKRFTGNQMELTYDPSVEGTIVRAANGTQAINLYQPGPIRPISGDWSPWEQFLTHLFPVDKDRECVSRWAATLIAKPGTRIKYGLLLMSETQGVGKGTFARVLADLIGLDNASFPSANMIVESQFNGWVDAKRLVCVDEIYEGHSWKAYNRLKPYVTDDKIEVNVKNLKTWSMPNWTHYILMSNSRAALKIENSDRRWLVPECTEEVWSEEEFAAFYSWLRGGGLAYVAHWAKTFLERAEGKFIRSGETAPMTASKMRLISESRSPAEQILDDLGQAVAELRDPVAMTMHSVMEWVRNQLGDRKFFETPQQMGRILRKHNLYATKDKNRVKIGGTRHTIIANQQEMVADPPWDTPRLRAVLKTPADLIQEPM